jgi:hypothetical protein
MFSRVVTGEEISPTAAHAGRKRRQKWVSAPWGIAGPSCPGGYKCSGLALQVGGWVTDRKPVIVKILLGNPDCGLGTVRLSEIDLSI